jgi:hypothetical protein
MTKMICNECETVAHCTSHGCIPKQTAVDRLLDEAKLLADARPVEVGNLPEWTLNAEHTIRRLVKALALVNEVDQEQPAQPQQEPVAWIRRHPNGALSNEILLHVQVEGVRRESGAWVPLYISPPTLSLAQRQARSADTWAGLTANEVEEIFQKKLGYYPTIYAVEAKLKEKNT